MLSAELKKQIDYLWQKFFSNGMADHMNALKHISYLIFMKKLEDYENDRIIAAKKSKKKYISIFDGHDDMRWSVWENYDGKKMLDHIRNNVFPFLKNLKSNGHIKLDFGDSYFEIASPVLLQDAIQVIDNLHISDENLDTQGDIYEYVSSKLETAGLNGAFRTPRHIIRMMVEILDPDINQKICDPACGTGGFLINSYLHILKKYNSKESTESDRIIGDNLSNSDRDFLFNKQFSGYDFETPMVQFSQMNMILHGFTQPNIKYQNSLGKNFDLTEEYDIIFANPPFSGQLNKSEIHDDFTLETGKTELLFMELFYKKLVNGGQAIIVVPTGSLYGTFKAHKQIRKLLMEKCRIDSIISMPTGIFRPYTGQATSIIYFTKGEPTKKVWFYMLENDGFKIDTKHNKPIKQNDIPDILQKIKTKKISEKSWVATFDDIKKKGWNLDAARYKPIRKATTPMKNSIELLDKILKIENDITSSIKKIKNDFNELI